MYVHLILFIITIIFGVAIYVLIIFGQAHFPKAKILYKGPKPSTIIQYYKDDATAFNNKKRSTIDGKGALNNRISAFLMEKITSLGITTHFIKRLNMREQLVHYVDIIHHLTSAKPFRVTAVGQKNFLKSKGVDTFDAIETVIEWKKGTNTFSSTFLCNWIDPNNTSAVSYQSVKFIGTKGRIESDQKNRGLQLITDRDGIEDINPYFNQNYTIENNVFL